MKGVLVDTSVWVNHFRHRNDALVDLLELDLVMAHPLIVGEIACGTPPNRIQMLSDLEGLQQTQQAHLREVLAFIERERLFGLGCGLVDMLLLASTLMTPEAELWTMDKRLCALAERFGVMHRPALH
ncbi:MULTISPECIES: VapC toxin family PIN domain ribonuclease [unclassified Pseudomonas]|uniref:type II toxin-antitoxin system VapC family toxin n=1 Tax=unclassified Pseudomonas TaxID=196821 RepID=UPI00128C8637|nr:MULTISPECIES: VapC toxin family PIN domain ribonuclease [unclassified Pseudomonas]MBV6752192.1 VapC toxin family PIN domain ribonuclease [Pseudomonas chlororaphis]MPQ66173.1 VapC toxin family PIN domain ribonuclease [Pseudomonas sp. MWU12-2323]